MATCYQQSDEQPADSAADRSLSLQRQAARLAGQAVQLYRWRAVCWWLAFTVLSTVLLVSADRLIHAEEVGLRWLISGLWLASLALAAWRFLKPAWTFSLAPVRVAQWIESRHPDLRGRLSNVLAIADLPPSDPRYGSERFRRAALERVPEDALAIDWRSVLDMRPTIWALAALLTLCATAAGLASVAPADARLGVRRLLNPWLAAPWPRADRLRFVNLPSMIASGSELQIEVLDDRPPLPADIELEIRLEDAAATSAAGSVTRRPMRVLNDVAIASIADMRGPFAVRAIGGDDRDTPWQSIQVAEMPELVEHQFHVEPPAYSRQKPTELVGERIEVLAGSRITFRARTSGRLREVVAVPVKPPGGRAPSAPAEGGPGDAAAESPAAGAASSASFSAQTATVAIDRTSFELFAADRGLLVDRDLRWQLRLTTQEGLEVTDAKIWSVHAVADRPPTVQLLPLEPTWITRESTVNVVGEAADDLELVEVKMLWQTADDAQPHSRTLWTPAPSASGAETTGAADADQEPSRLASIRFQWKPADDALPPRQPIAVMLEARDSAGQTTRSATQSLQIQDPQAVLAHIEAEEAKAFQPLHQLWETQRRNQQVVDRARDIVRATDALEPAQLDALASARQIEQSISEQLAQSRESVLAKLQSLGEQLRRNRLENSDQAKHIAKLAAEIERLNERAVIPAIEELDEAQRLIRSALDQPAAPTSQIAAASAQVEKAAARQQRAVQELRKLVDSVASAETTAELRKELTELIARQLELRSQTEQLQVERVLHPETRASQSKQVGLRSDQQSLARSVDDLAATIDKHLKASDESQEPALESLSRAREALIEQRVSQQMREAAELLGSGQLSSGIDVQRRAAEALEKAAQLDKPPGSQNLVELGKAMSELVRYQSPIVDRLNELTNLHKSDGKQPADWDNALREAAARQAATRQRLLDVAASVDATDTFAWLLEQCKTDMTRAVAALERQRLEPDAVTSAESALRKLNAAATALREQRDLDKQEAEPSNDGDDAQSEESKAGRQPTMASLKLLRALQADIHQRTERVQANPSSAADKELQRLAEEQQSLAQQTKKLMEQLAR